MTLSFLTASALAVPAIVVLALPVLLAIVALRKRDDDPSRAGFVPVYIRAKRPEIVRNRRDQIR